MDIGAIEQVQNVAIYLRKSRDEEGTDVLDKHRQRLTEIAEVNGWKYTIYEEIGSSDTIEFRPQFSKLLEDIELKLFDAVLVVHTDRLTRGDMYEYGLIKRVFQRSETLVVTPSEVIDYAEKNVMQDIRHSLARYEYVTIGQRLQDGKIAGAKKGYWINGPAPYGYTYNRETRHLEVNDKQSEIYRYIVQQYLGGKGIQRIAVNLRLMGSKSPRGSYWQEATIKRLLQNPVFLGKTTYQRTSGSLHKKKKTQSFRVNPEEKWIVVDNTHPPLISQKEFDKVQYLLSQNQRIPVAARSGKQILSGLVYCGKCGAAMTFNRKENKSGLVVALKTCQKYSPEGVKCGNPGINTTHLMNILEHKLDKYEKQLRKRNNRKSEQRAMQVSENILEKRQTLKSQQNVFGRIKEMFRLGVIDKEELLHETDKHKELLRSIEQDIRSMEKQLAYISNESNKARLRRFEEFNTHFDLNTLDNETANKMLHTIVDKIHYSRTDTDIQVTIDFK